MQVGLTTRSILLDGGIERQRCRNNALFDMLFAPHFTHARMADMDASAMD